MPSHEPAPPPIDAEGSVDLAHQGASPSGFSRIAQAVRRRFRWLLGASLVAHLVFTPVIGWLGLIEHWLEQEVPEPPHEELDAIPIDLIDVAEEDEPKDPSGLPDKDPVEVIEQILAPPVAPTATVTTTAAPAATPPPPKPVDPQLPRATPSASASASKPKAKPPRDAGAPTKKKPRKGAKKPVEAGAPKPGPKAPRQIENPVAMAGKAGEIVNSNARLQLIVYTERLRGHAIGDRVAHLLPRLPQWNDFFGAGVVNPIRDFDRFFVAGTSFYHSDQLVIAMEYNTKREKIVGAVDALVKRDGQWLDGVPVPVARAVADRAERVFVVGEKPVIWIVPPKLQEQALKLRSRRIPRSKGPEAMVANIREPSVSLARLDLDIPKSVHDVKLRLTPLPEGQVKIELSALDESAEAAERTVRAMNPRLNTAMVVFRAFIAARNIFTIGHRESLELAPFELHARAKEIWASYVLSKVQADFILDFIEMQVPLAAEPGAAKPGSSSGANKSGKSAAPGLAPQKPSKPGP